MSKFRIILYVFVCSCVAFNAHAGLEFICNSRNYISKCGTYTVGTYWLKGFHNGTNFYDYSEDADNVTNLKHFFNGEAFYYTDRAGEYKYANPNEVIAARDDILNSLCTLENAICTECPNGGYTPGHSKFNISTQKWNMFYSFAHCYLQSFSDSTGIYQYRDDYEHPQTCYYNTDIRGSDINNILSQQDISNGETGDDTGSNF